MTFKR